METIVAAIISAIASIVVAWIGRGSAPPSAESSSIPTVVSLPVPRSFSTAWIILLALLIPWIVLTPILIHHDFPGINLFVIAVVTILASIVWPIRPLSAAAIVLGLHPVNFFMEPLAKIVRHMPYPMGGIDNSKAFFLIALFSSNALIVAALCFWRRRSLAARTVPSATSLQRPAPNPRGAAHPEASASLSAELNALASLHASGKLTDDEFRKAKERLLGR